MVVCRCSAPDPPVETVAHRVAAGLPQMHAGAQAQNLWILYYSTFQRWMVSGIVNLKSLLPTTAICTGSRRLLVMANWMQAQSPIHWWLLCIHQARGGEQNPAGKTQVVKGLLQRGTPASTARQLEQVKQDTPPHELAHYQSDPAGSQAPHCLLLAVSCGCESPFHHQLSIPHSLWITPALIPLWFRSQSWYKTSNKPGWWPCTKISVDIEQQKKDF